MLQTDSYKQEFECSCCLEHKTVS